MQHAGEDPYGRALRWWMTDSRERATSPYSLVPASAEESLARPRFPRRDPKATPAQIDLAPFYTAMLDQDPSMIDLNNTLEELPAGLHEWNGIAFDARGVVQLGLEGGNMHSFPRMIDEIPVAQKCRALHLVGAVRNVNGSQGDEVLRLVVHYADGSIVEHPFNLGIDVGDWWLDVRPAEDRLVWTGTNPAARAVGNDIGVYGMRWENPRPEQVVASVDLVAFNRGGAPFILAITAEP
jgi:hypothetical protein